MTAAAAAKRTSVTFILAIVVFVKLEVCSEVQIPSEWFEWNLGTQKTLLYMTYMFILPQSTTKPYSQRPIAKLAQHLGADIEVLRMPRSCSLVLLTGPHSRETGGIAETEANSAGRACWVREICAWRAVGVEELGMPRDRVVEESALDAEGGLLLEERKCGVNFQVPGVVE
jgi:hypothetical protein